MPPSEHRVFGLDLMRAIAILVVVQQHGAHILSPYVYSYRFNYFTLDGVSLFFVLSGFLIGRILLKMVARPVFSGAHLREFWVRRWFRTMPNYLFVLLVLLACHWAVERELPADVARFFIFSQNIASPHPHFFPEAWSLAVEEWFYLMLPLPFFFAGRLHATKRTQLTLALIAVGIVGIAAFRAYRAARFGDDPGFAWDTHLRKQVFTRLDSMMYGVLGAWLVLNRAAWWQAVRWPALGAGIALLLTDKLLGTAPLYIHYVKLSLVPLAALCLLPMLSGWRRPDDLLSKCVTFISVMSYSMYLLNLTFVQTYCMPFLLRATAQFKLEPLVIYLVYWCVTIGASYLLYHGFERHMTNLRDRSRPAEADVAPAVRASSTAS